MDRRSMNILAAFALALSLTLGFAGQGLAQDAAAETNAAEVKAEVKAPVVAPKALSIDELLERVRTHWRAERSLNEKREKEFRAAKSQQKQMLEKANAELAAEEARGTALEADFAANEITIAEQEELLHEKLGTLGELFGVVRQVAGDTRSQIENSLISAEFPGRREFLDQLGQSKALPSIESLEKLWGTLLQEMSESAKIVRFKTPIVKVTGEEVEAEVVRIGSFNAVSDGKYLKWISEEEKLGEIGRQPAPKYVSTIEDLEEATDGFVKFAIDPARGQILALLVNTPTFKERIAYGGAVGYAIIGLGTLTFVFGFLRLIYVFMVSRQVASQKKSATPKPGNPLGRVLQIHAENKNFDTETLELKLEEQVLKETAQIEGYLWLIKVVSAVAPLMGLLGTVTGMINTFQIITLFGTGDPKMMASGISEALVTTMLGLLAAIPLVLMHSLLASLARGVTNVLEEQTTGLIAVQSEAESDGKPGIESA
jgi:biopolymer transport protein ExbB